jgi:hypothetical protein
MTQCPPWSALFGQWNWWLPRWLARMLFVEPSPLRPIVRTWPATGRGYAAWAQAEAT